MTQFCIDGILKDRDDLLEDGYSYFGDYGFVDGGHNENEARFALLIKDRRYLSFPTVKPSENSTRVSTHRNNLTCYIHTNHRQLSTPAAVMEA